MLTPNQPGSEVIAEATDEGSRSAEEHDVTPSSNGSQRPRSPTGRKHYLTELTRLSLLIIDDLDMRKLPHDAAEDLLELVMRRYERTSTVLTWNRPVEDWVAFSRVSCGPCSGGCARGVRRTVRTARCISSKRRFRAGKRRSTSPTRATWA